MNREEKMFYAKSGVMDLKRDSKSFTPNEVWKRKRARGTWIKRGRAGQNIEKVKFRFNTDKIIYFGKYIVFIKEAW